MQQLSHKFNLHKAYTFSVFVEIVRKAIIQLYYIIIKVILVIGLLECLLLTYIRVWFALDCTGVTKVLGDCISVFV